MGWVERIGRKTHFTLEKGMVHMFRKLLLAVLALATTACGATRRSPVDSIERMTMTPPVCNAHTVGTVSIPVTTTAGTEMVPVSTCSAMFALRFAGVDAIRVLGTEEARAAGIAAGRVGFYDSRGQVQSLGIVINGVNTEPGARVTGSGGGWNWGISGVNSGPTRVNTGGTTVRTSRTP